MTEYGQELFDQSMRVINAQLSFPLSRTTDPVSSHEAEAELKTSGRQGSQCAAILKELQEGPCAAKWLATISLKYTSRISDLRKLGHRIVYDSGTRLYELEANDAGS